MAPHSILPNIRKGKNSSIERERDRQNQKNFRCRETTVDRKSVRVSGSGEAAYARFCPPPCFYLPTSVGLLLIYMRLGAVMDHFFIISSSRSQGRRRRRRRRRWIPVWWRDEKDKQLTPPSHRASFHLCSCLWFKFSLQVYLCIIFSFFFYFVATGARSYYSTRARTARLTSSIRREKHWRPSPSQLMASTWCRASAATNRPCAFGISLSAHRWPSSLGTCSVSFAWWVFFFFFISLLYYTETSSILSCILGCVTEPS